MSDEVNLRLAYLNAHQDHLRSVYRLRGMGLGLAGFTILIGAVMTFLGLEGTFDWAIEAPNTIGAKLTNASPAIIFATVGLIIAFVVLIQGPVQFKTKGREPDGPDWSYSTIRNEPKRKPGDLDSDLGPLVS